MKISEIRQFWEAQQALHGDVEIYREENDGKSTFSMPYTPRRLELTKIWETHPDEPRWYVRTWE